MSPIHAGFFPTPALLEHLEDRTLLSIDVLVSDLNPATTDVGNSQHSSDIDISLNGTVVAWASVTDSGDSDVRFRRYTSTGVPLDATDRVVSFVTSDNEWMPTVATGPDGSFAIAYISIDAEGDKDAYFDIYDANGAFTSRVQVYGAESESQDSIEIAVTPLGNIVVVWDERGEGTGGGDVLARVYDDQGNALTEIIPVLAPSGDYEWNPSIAVDAAGNFVVAYNFASSAAAFQRFAADGTSQGPPEVIGENVTGAKLGLQIAGADDGSFVVSYTVMARLRPTVNNWHLFNADGSQRTEGNFGSNITQSIDMDAFGNFVVMADGSTTFFDSAGRRGETIAVSGNVAIENNLLAISDSTAGDVEFSIIEQRRGKIGVARPNSGGGLTFHLDSNANNVFDAFDSQVNFGLAGDTVVIGDWNGDGIDDLGVARPNGSGGLTFFLDSNDNLAFDDTDAVFNFGLEGDSIVVGDWNGDGVDNLGVARANGQGGLKFSLDSNGTWSFDAADAVFDFGLEGDTLVVGDWNGDGVDNLGVARPTSTGGMTFSLDSDGNWLSDSNDVVFNFGLAGDRVIVGDWDGDGIDGLGAARQNGTGGQSVYLDVNENYQFDLTDSLFAFEFGLPDELIITGSWKQTGLRFAEVG